MTAPTNHDMTPASRQRGAVLFISLIFLLALTLLGVMLARSQTTEERMAQNDANHDMAVESAGTALRFAESNIEAGNYTAGIQSNAAGLYQLSQTTGSIYTPTIWSNPLAVVSYGGAALASVSAPAEFIVEEIPQPVILPGSGNLAGGTGGIGSQQTATAYQITAHASGGDLTGTVTLRSIFLQEN